MSNTIRNFPSHGQAAISLPQERQTEGSAFEKIEEAIQQSLPLLSSLLPSLSGAERLSVFEKSVSASFRAFIQENDDCFGDLPAPAVQKTTIKKEKKTKYKKKKQDQKVEKVS